MSVHVTKVFECACVERGGEDVHWLWMCSCGAANLVGVDSRERASTEAFMHRWTSGMQPPATPGGAAPTESGD